MKRAASAAKLTESEGDESLKKKKLLATLSEQSLSKEPSSRLRRSASSNAMEKLKQQMRVESSASESEFEDEMEAECSCEEKAKSEEKREKKAKKKENSSKSAKSKSTEKKESNKEKKPKLAKKQSTTKASSTADAEVDDDDEKKKAVKKPKLVKKNTKNLGSQSRSSSKLAENLVLEHTHKQHRAIGNAWIGAHVSAAGGVDNAVLNATRLRANAFALFLKNQRQWNIPPLEQETIDRFRQLMQEHGYVEEWVFVSLFVSLSVVSLFCLIFFFFFKKMNFAYAVVSPVIKFFLTALTW
jgi:cobalamin biosynthesis Mg chelatase CobN